MSGRQYCESDRTPADYADLDLIERWKNYDIDITDDREPAWGETL